MFPAACFFAPCWQTYLAFTAKVSQGAKDSSAQLSCNSSARAGEAGTNRVERLVKQFLGSRIGLEGRNPRAWCGERATKGTLLPLGSPCLLDAKE